MSDGILTLVVITFAMRREYAIPESQTYALVRGDQILGTDKDKPPCIEPRHWALDVATHLGVRFEAPDPSANFAMHEDTGVWFAYLSDAEVFEDDGKRVGRSWDSMPWVKGVIRNANRAGAAA